MKWTRFKISTHVDAVDILSYELDNIGVCGIEIEDHKPLSESDKEKMFVDILPEPEVNDDVAFVSFYIEEPDVDVERIKDQVKIILNEISEYTNIGEGTIEVSETEDIDWINNWKKYFHAFRASDRIAIVPRWTDDIDEELIKPVPGKDAPQVLRIDPGIAFGTGSHETTKLCIRAIDEYLNPGEKVLDVGCGSGILSIVALLLGAGYATAVDIDPIAVEVAKENFDDNNRDGSTYELIAGNLLGDDEFVKRIRTRSREMGPDGYDMVIANILPDVIVPLTALVPLFLKKGGLYITSGILAERESEVRVAMEKAGFKDLKTTPMGEWVSVTGRI